VDRFVPIRAIRGKDVTVSASPRDTPIRGTAFASKRFSSILLPCFSRVLPSAGGRYSAQLAGVHSEEEFDFLQQSQALSDELLEHLRALIPAGWALAILRLDVGLSALACARAVKHRLWNPLTDQQVEDFPERFFEVTTCLHAVFSMHGKAWSRCLIVCRRDGERVQCDTHYHYGKPKSPR
jgi:hypothetical protein